MGNPPPFAVRYLKEAGNGYVADAFFFLDAVLRMHERIDNMQRTHIMISRHRTREVVDKTTRLVSVLHCELNVANEVLVRSVAGKDKRRAFVKQKRASMPGNRIDRKSTRLNSSHSQI